MSLLVSTSQYETDKPPSFSTCGMSWASRSVVRCSFSITPSCRSYTSAPPLNAQGQLAKMMLGPNIMHRSDGTPATASVHLVNAMHAQLHGTRHLHSWPKPLHRQTAHATSSDSPVLHIDREPLPCCLPATSSGFALASLLDSAIHGIQGSPSFLLAFLVHNLWLCEGDTRLQITSLGIVARNQDEELWLLRSPREIGGDSHSQPGQKVLFEW